MSRPVRRAPGTLPREERLLTNEVNCGAFVRVEDGLAELVRMRVLTVSSRVRLTRSEDGETHE
jgi:hypothetical protein